MKTDLHLRHLLLSEVVRILIFLPCLLSWGISFGQQDTYISAFARNHTIRQLYTDDSSGSAAYVVVSTNGAPIERYNGLVIKIYPDSGKEEMNLQIESKRDRTILVELRNRSDDELLFQELKLKAGKNIIPFQTDDMANDSYRINLSRMHSNRTTSYLVLKN